MNQIDMNTGVSVAVLIGTFPLLLGCVGVWYQLRGIKKVLKKVWTIPAQKVFAERLESHNAKLALTVPDVDKVLETFNGSKP